MKKYIFLLMAFVVTAMAHAQIPGTIPYLKGYVLQSQANPPSNPVLHQRYLDQDGNRYRYNGSAWLIDDYFLYDATLNGTTLELDRYDQSVITVDLSSLAGGAGGASTNATSFKDITTSTYTLTTADRSTNTQSLRLQFNNASDITVSEPSTKGDGNVYRLVQDGAGKVVTDFYVHIGTNDSLYASTSYIGHNILIEWDNDNEKWFVTGKPDEYTPIVDAAQDVALVADFNADNLTETNGQTVSTLKDPNSEIYMDFTQSPIVEVRGDGRKEVQFDGVDQAAALRSNYAALDFTPDSDDYTIILVLGNDTVGDEKILNKGSLAGLSGTQFAIDANAAGTNIGYIAGAQIRSYSGSKTNIEDDVIVIRGTSGNIEILQNNVSLGTFSAGSYTTTQVWSLASRASGTDSFNEMSFRRLLFYNDDLSNTRLTEIYDQEK